MQSHKPHHRSIGHEQQGTKAAEHMTVYLCYARSGKEFEVAGEIEKLGMDVYCARRMRFIRKGKKRRAEPEVSPYLQNYLFVNIPAERYLDVLAIRYLASTTMALSKADKRALGLFRAAVDAEFATQEKKRLNQEAVSEYEPGQALQFLDGRFSDSMLTFRAIVERPHDVHPKIKASMEMMGREVTMEIDPLSVKAAE